MGERENGLARGSLLLSCTRFFLCPPPNPLLSPSGGLIISSPFEGGGLIETGSLFETGGLIYLKTTMVSQAVLHKELDCKVEKLKYRKF